METDKAKMYFWVILDLLLLGILVNLVVFVMPAIAAYRNSLPSMYVMTVSAEGKTTVEPDIALASFSVISRGLNPEQLTENNNDKMTAVVQFVKSEGIDAKDIKTTNYDLSPNYRYDPETERNFITGYTLTQTIHVKMRDLAKVAKIVGGLTPLGVNQIGGITFTLDNKDTALAAARSDAFKNAREKAAVMARENGGRLGRIVNINEYTPVTPYYGVYAGKGIGGGMEAAAPSIEPGSQEYTIQVTLTYAIK